MITLSCLSTHLDYCYSSATSSYTIISLKTRYVPSYTVTTHTYTPSQKPLVRDIIITGAVIGAIMLYVFLIVEGRVRLSHLGLIANFFTICFFASPLSTMVSKYHIPHCSHIPHPSQVTVIRSQNTESMSLLFSILSSLVTSLWTLYGLAISDVYVQVHTLFLRAHNLC